MKKQTQYQLKKQAEALKEIRLAEALAKHKVTARAQKLKGSKRKDVAELARFVALPLNASVALRDAEAFVAKSHNLGKQVQALVDHVFVAYPVPLFLYQAVLTQEGRIQVLGGDHRNCRASQWHRDLFLAAAQGRSVAKLLVDRLNKRETHWFLQAPIGNSITQNLFWAKCAAAGVPQRTCQFLTERLMVGGVAQRLGDRLADVLRFYAQFADAMTEYTRAEVTDFVRAMADNPEFSFKGRTLGSMIKLSREWHRTFYSGRVARYQSWAGRFPIWERQEKGILVRALELTNNRALAEEGRKQHHCVFTYTWQCAHGTTRIVSLRWFAKDENGADRIVKRLTIEVSRNEEVVQVRGSLNRAPSDAELKTLNTWAGDNGLRVTWV